MWRLLCFLLVVFSSVSYAHGSFVQTIKEIKPAIVGVGFYSVEKQQNVLIGTGFVIGNGQYVVTNFHVIAANKLIKGKYNRVIFSGKGRREDIHQVEIVASSEKYDLAILKHSGPRLSALALAPSPLISEGNHIAFTGFPIGAVLGLYPVTHQGLISSITPIVIPASRAEALTPSVIKTLRNPYLVYQLDAVAYPGNSGSPVYMQDSGEVIAIINKVFVKESKEAAISAPSGITYAIPVVFLKELISLEKIDIDAP